MKLSRRLETVASFVPKGSNLADIGTDHGYVPIYLVKERIAVHAIAMDVRTGPLARARDHVREYGLEDRVFVRLSDGLKELKPGEADCVIIAGMGGELIIKILTEGRHMWDSVGYWVLSPHSESDKVRRFLREQSFFTDKETMIEEDGKFYTVMGVRGLPCAGQAAEEEIRGRNLDTEDRYGRLLIEQKNPVLKAYLEKEHKKLTAVLSGLPEHGSDKVMERRTELIYKLRLNEEAQDEMQ